MNRGSAAGSVRIVIADDHAIVLAGLRKLLESEPDFSVVGQATTGDEAVALTQRLRPDILLLDVAMPGGTGLDALTRVGQMAGVRTVILTAGVEEEERARAFRLGARGILLKDAATDLLFDGIRAVMRGDYWLWRTSASAAETMATPPRPRNAVSLTPREQDVLRGIVDGCSNREIAIRLGISEDTIKHHVSSLFDKTGASTRVELALFAVHRRMVE